MAAVPKRSRTLVERGVEGVAATVERQRELDGAVVVEVADRDADQREAPALDQSAWPSPAAPARWRGSSAVCAVGVGQRVRPGGAGEVVEAQPQHDGAADPPGGAQPAGHPVDEPDERRRRAASGDRRPRPSARCEPIERRRRPTCTGRGSRLWARACRCRPAARPSIETSAASASPATSPTVVIPRSCSLSGGDRADAPQPLDRQRVQEGELAVGRHHQQAVGLGHAAGHLGQELRPGDADGDRQPDLLAHLAAQPHGDLASAGRRSGAGRATSRNASSIERPSTSGVVSANTSNTALLASE